MTAFLVSMTIGQDRPGGEVQARSTLRNLQALPRFQRLCNHYGVTPTYLLTYPVLQDPITAWLGAQAALGHCELGICLQAWTTPPFEANENRLTITPLNQLTGARVQSKLETLVGAYRQVFGQLPAVHRGDGPDLSGACLQGLEGLGVAVDTSATPGYHNEFAGQLDWRAAPESPYFPSRQDPALRGHSPVLEVPITAGAVWGGPLRSDKLLGMLRRSIESTVLSRIIEKSFFSMGPAKYLDPARLPVAHMRALADQAVRSHLPHINAALRSEYLAAGESDVNSDAATVTATFDAIDSLFRYAIDTLRLTPSTVGAYARQHTRPGDA